MSKFQRFPKAPVSGSPESAKLVVPAGGEEVGAGRPRGGADQTQAKTRNHNSLGLKVCTSSLRRLGQGLTFLNFNYRTDTGVHAKCNYITVDLEPFDQKWDTFPPIHITSTVNKTLREAKLPIRCEF